MMVINGYQVEVKDWSYTLLQQCESLGISVPRFCYHETLSIAGNCRMCMVELETSVKPVIACSTSLTKGMSVWTNSVLVKKARENVLELLLINHPLDCPICDQGGECDLQDQTMVYGGDRGRFKEEKRSVSDKALGPFIKTIMTRCIHCTRCVRFCDEVLGESSLGTMGRGNATEIGTYLSKSVTGELSGNVIDLCPVGALTSKPYAFNARPWELESVESIDIFDGLGSNIRVDVKNNQVVRILPKWNPNVNDHWITDKIRFSYDGLLIERLTWPMYKSNGRFIYSSWSFVSSLFDSYSPMLGKIYMGELLDLETLSALQLWSMNNNVLWGTNSAQFTSRSQYILSKDIFNNPLVLVGVNLKKECSVLNAMLRQKNLPTTYIGPNVFSNLSSKHMGLLNHGNILLGKFIVSGNVLDSFNTMDELNHKEVGVFGLHENEYVHGSVQYDILFNYNKKLNDNVNFRFYIGHHGSDNAMSSDCIMPICCYGEYSGSYINLFGLVQKTSKVIYVGGMIKDLGWVLQNLFGSNLKMLGKVSGIAGVSISLDSLVSRTVKSNIYDFNGTNIISQYSRNMHREVS